MKSIIIDDEQKAIQTLEGFLQQYCPNVNITATASSMQDGLTAIATHEPDLVFLDIEMEGGSGFDLLEKLPHLNFEIIFVTSHEDYALQAIKFCAIGYILKPIRELELVTAVNHAQVRINEKVENIRNKQLLQNLVNPRSANNKIGIPTDRGLEFVETGKIIRCEGVQRCTKVVLQNKAKIVSSYNLGEFRKLLEQYNFYAPHKSHLISLEHIIRYDREGTVEMSDGEVVPVARRRRQEFLQKMTRL